MHDVGTKLSLSVIWYVEWKCIVSNAQYLFFSNFVESLAQIQSSSRLGFISGPLREIFGFDRFNVEHDIPRQLYRNTSNTKTPVIFALGHIA